MRAIIGSNVMLNYLLLPSVVALSFIVICAVPGRAAESASPARSDPGTYRNPLGVDIADPDVLYHEGIYYLYGTSAPDGFKVWTSEDLVHWREHGYAFRRDENSWGRDLFWAPCVIEHKGAFYLFYSCRGRVDKERESLRIGVARSDSPLGPFVDVKAPLFDIGKAVIDAHVLIDSGQPYLYYVLDTSENGESQVWVVRLTPDLTSTVGEPKLCIKPSQPWEGDQWNEAPFVFKAGETYVMTYSAQGFYDPRYSIGYATAPDPFGPWTKSEQNPLMQRTEEVSGPGHNTMTHSPDGTERILVYHVHKSLKGGHERELAIDRLTVTTHRDGSVTLHTDGPTQGPEPMPSADPDGCPTPDSRHSSVAHEDDGRER